MLQARLRQHLNDKLGQRERGKGSWAISTPAAPFFPHVRGALSAAADFRIRARLRAGGFFDGILLHQILQWHHLLSAIDGGDARFQVAADGYFHILMYVVAVIGIWMLWRGSRGGTTISGGLLFAYMLVGFGAWHVLDSVLSHWVLGIHRIRMDTDARLLWDLIWFGAFGMVPLAAGLWMRRRRRSELHDGGRGRTASVLTALLVAGAGAWSLTPSDNAFTTVLFAPGTSPKEIWAAIASVDGRLVWSDPSGELNVIQAGKNTEPWRLYLKGAFLVGGTGLPVGCFDWSRAF